MSWPDDVYVITSQETFVGCVFCNPSNETESKRMSDVMGQLNTKLASLFNSQVSSFIHLLIKSVLVQIVWVSINKIQW